MPRDYQRSKVYAAEDKVFNKSLPPEFVTLDECRVVALKITNSDYWKMCGGLKRFKLGDGRGRQNACYKGKENGHRNDQICLPKWSRSTWIIIHEFAHFLTSRTDKGTAHHGSIFCRHYIELVRELMGEHDAERLEAQFKQDKVGVKPHKIIL